MSREVHVRFCEQLRGQFPWLTRLVVYCESREDAEECYELLKQWLIQRGLQFSDEKTRIIHLKEGYDFLGFHIRLYPCTVSRFGYKMLIKPSKATENQVRRKLRETWMNLIGKDSETVIKLLNPIIRGQANYYRTGVSSEFFSTMDSYLWMRQTRYAKRMHPKKSKKWRIKRYWGRYHPYRNDNWVFKDQKTGRIMLKYKWFRIRRHVLVKGRASPDDPNLKQYWLQRNAKVFDRQEIWGKISQRQKGICPWCKEFLNNGEPLEMDHMLPKSQGGTNQISNFQLLHYFCHQQKSCNEDKVRIA